MRLALSILPVLLVAGCASRAADTTACQARGGTVRSVGLVATPVCVIRYPDAGRICTDHSDCTGTCRADPGAVAGDAAAGSCQRDNRDVTGCDLRVEAGVVVGGMCVE